MNVAAYRVEDVIEEVSRKAPPPDLWREPDVLPRYKTANINKLASSATYSMLALRLKMDGYDGRTLVAYWDTQNALREVRVGDWVYRAQSYRWDKKRVQECR